MKRGLLATLFVCFTCFGYDILNELIESYGKSVPKKDLDAFYHKQDQKARTLEQTETMLAYLIVKWETKRQIDLEFPFLKNNNEPYQFFKFNDATLSYEECPVFEWTQLRRSNVRKVYKEVHEDVFDTLKIVRLQSAIDTLLRISPNFIALQEEMKELKEEWKCPICLADLLSCVCTKTCAKPHKFHKECLEQWLQNKDVCPLCKASPVVYDDSQETLLGQLYKKQEKRLNQYYKQKDRS